MLLLKSCYNFFHIPYNLAWPHFWSTSKHRFLLKLKPFAVLFSVDIVISVKKSKQTETMMSIENKARNSPSSSFLIYSNSVFILWICMWGEISLVELLSTIQLTGTSHNVFFSRNQNACNVGTWSRFLLHTYTRMT